MQSLSRMETAGHHSPDDKIGMLVGFEVGVAWVFGVKTRMSRVQDQPFHCHLAVKDGDNHVTVLWFKGPVDHHPIAMEDACPFHGVTDNRHDERVGRMPDDVTI